MKLPKTDISIMDVRNILGYPSTDLGTLCSCGEPYVNKWSKYKPVVHSCTYTYPADWWKSDNFDCGISYKEHATLQAFINSINNGEEQFPYQPPTGGTASPYRLGDFRGYDSNAQPPIFGSNVEGSEYAKNSGSIKFTPIANIASDDTLTVKDIFSRLGNVYYGVALVSGSTSWWMTSANYYSGSNTDAVVNFPMSNLKDGTTYSVYQFLTNLKSTTPQSNLNTAAKFVAVPAGKNASPIQHIKVIDTYLKVTLTGCILTKADKSKFEVKDKITGTIRVDNSTGGSARLASNYIEWRYQDSKDNTGYWQGESSGVPTDLNGNSLQVINAPTGGSEYKFKIEAPNILTQIGEHGGGKVILYSNQSKMAQTFILQPMNPNI